MKRMLAAARRRRDRRNRAGGLRELGRHARGLDGGGCDRLAVREHGHRDHGPDHDHHRSGNNVDDLDDLGNDHDLG